MNHQKRPDIIENFEIESAPILKRVGSSLIDFAVFFLLFFLIGLAVRPILNATMNIEETILNYNHALKRSHLVTLDEAIAEDEANLDDVDITQNFVVATSYASATYYFYTHFMAEHYPTETDSYDHNWYLTHVLKLGEEASYFEAISPEESQIRPMIRFSDTLSNSTSEDTSLTSDASSESEPTYDQFLPVGVALKSSTTEEDIVTFNRNIYSDAIYVFNDLDIVRTYANTSMFESVLNILLASTIIYLAIPLFLKNGQTLGKLVFKLALVTSHGYRISHLKILLRYIVFFILYLLSFAIQPYVGFALMFISLTIVVFSKKARGLHEFIVFTRVIDMKKSHIYEDEKHFIDMHPHLESSQTE